MIKSKLTAKARTTMPQPVRMALRLKEGDEIAYSIEEGRVILSKVKRDALNDPFVTFKEWGGAGDRKAYGNL